MTNEEKIKELKKELAKLEKHEESKSKVMKEKQEIADLKKKIKQKKRAGLIRVGKNLKTIGKAVGKGASKFVGEDPKKKGKQRPKTVDEILKELPQ